ncbi:DUF2304 domain-containing protein [Domibacillus iocasae]|uniref:DUF2304 domain-containing protein n=1 Tax=Domibacillus iocasae TaxID=1714016 RepID=A0A1E7DPF7_9BACI|nr:DUF2304 domain-containing protein [Domibacillus iocasae]OES44961.1 hypothetical protein BA724_06775 [Domibacillus iocasae]
MNIIQLIVSGAALLLFILTVTMTAKNKLTDQYAFMWLAFSLLGVLMSFALPSLNRFATALGIAYMPSLIYLIAFLVVLALLIYHTHLLSKQEARTRVLVQEVAFLKKEVAEMKKKEDRGL